MEIEEILAKGADAAIEQVGKAVSKVTGSPAGEFGELLADHIRFRRAENLVKFYVKYQRIVEAAGIDQTAVPFRLWFPIFDSASIEEDDSLQQKWAALLANAANPDSDVSVLPVFAGILGQISPGQAALMDWFYKGEDEPAGIVSATEVSNVCQVGLTDASLMLTHLSQLGLLHGRTTTERLTQDPGPDYAATSFGVAFVKACCAPSTVMRKKEK